MEGGAHEDVALEAALVCLPNGDGPDERRAHAWGGGANHLNVRDRHKKQLSACITGIAARRRPVALGRPPPARL